MPHPRYHRQSLLPEIGDSGQDRLAHSHALLVGCGALGCTIADLLVRAGVGTLTIVDRDAVELTNLQRQTLFDERDARDAAPKAEAAAARLTRVNSLIKVRPLVSDFSSRNAEQILGEGTPRIGVLIDGTDNFAARYLLNDLAVKHSIPLIYGGAVATTGMSLTVLPHTSACLRCIFPDIPAPGAAMTCDTAGILGPVATMVAAMEAIEAIKILSGNVDARSRDLVEFDPWRSHHRRIGLANAKDPACPCCALRRFDFLDGRHESDASVICTRVGGGAVQIQPARPVAHRASSVLDLPALALRLSPHGSFALSPSTLRGTLAGEPGESAHPIELTLFSDGRAIIRGTTDPAAARALYARYVGE